MTYLLNNQKKITSTKTGFTLIELLIVIAIIAILAAIIITALNPLKRFQDARDSRRWSDVIGLLNAIIIDQVDNGGFYLDNVANLNVGEIYMIGTATSGCDNQNAYCANDVSSDIHCVNLTDLATEGYLGKIAVAPNAAASPVTWSNSITGYTLERKTDYNIVVRSCQSESGFNIEVMH